MNLQVLRKSSAQVLQQRQKLADSKSAKTNGCQMVSYLCQREGQTMCAMWVSIYIVRVRIEKSKNLYNKLVRLAVSWNFQDQSLKYDVAIQCFKYTLKR